MSWFEGVPLLPEWLNLFPILMMITWGISSHMQPLPEDPQQRQTAKMLRWMPMMPSNPVFSRVRKSRSPSSSKSQP